MYGSNMLLGSPGCVLTDTDDEDVEGRPRPFHRHSYMAERGGHIHHGGSEPHCHEPYPWDD